MSEASAPLLAACVMALLAVGATLSSATRRRRAFAIALTLATVVAAGYSGVVLLGRPQPTEISLAMPSRPWVDVLFADWTEGTGIYVLARHPGGMEPRLYVLPWHRSLAEQLQQAIILARNRGGGLRMADVFRIADQDLADHTVFTVAGTASPDGPQ